MSWPYICSAKKPSKSFPLVLFSTSWFFVEYQPLGKPIIVEYQPRDVDHWLLCCLLVVLSTERGHRQKSSFGSLCCFKKIRMYVCRYVCWYIYTCTYVHRPYVWMYVSTSTTKEVDWKPVSLLKSSFDVHTYMMYMMYVHKYHFNLSPSHRQRSGVHVCPLSSLKYC
jgi:hypothetical protein